MTPRLHPTGCVIIALPRDLAAARQAADVMLGVAEAVPLDPVAVVAPAPLTLPATARRVDPPARAGAMNELRVGLANLTSSDAEAAVIWPAAQASVRTETVLALVDAFRHDRTGALIPTVDGKPGMPLIIARDQWGAIVSADAPTVHEAVRASLPVVRELHVADRGVLQESADSTRGET